MKKNKRIVFLALRLGSHGGNRVIIDLANYLANNNFAITIITSKIDKHPYKINKNIDIKCFPNSKFKLFNYVIFILYSLFFIRRNETVVSTFFITFYIAFIRSLFTKIKHLYFVQGIESIRDGFFGKILNKLCDLTYNFDKIVTSNSSISDYLKRKNKKVYEEINIGPSNIFFNKEFNNISKQYDLIYFVRKENYKRLDRFIKFISTDYAKSLNILAVSQDRNLIKKLKSNFSFIKFYLPKDDSNLIHLIDNSKCLFYTSEYEGFGLPIYECLARKVPFIAYELSALVDFENTELKDLIIKDDNEVIKKFKKILSDDLYRNKIANIGYNIVQNYKMKYANEKFLECLNLHNET